MQITFKLNIKQGYRVSRKRRYKMVRYKQYKIIQKWYESEKNHKEQQNNFSIRRINYRKQYYKEPEFYKHYTCGNNYHISGSSSIDDVASVETMNTGTTYRDSLDDIEIKKGNYSRLKEFINVPIGSYKREDKSSSYSSVYSSFSYLSDYWRKSYEEEWEKEVFFTDEDIKTIEKEVAREKETNLQKFNFNNKIKNNNREGFVRSKL